jgi:hypothetical protein
VTRREFLGWLAIAGAAGCTGCGEGSSVVSARAPGAAQVRDPAVHSADDLVRDVARCYRTAFSAHVEVAHAWTGADPPPAPPRTTELWLERPDKLATRDRAGELPELISNRQAHFTVMRSQQQYRSGESLGTLDALALNPSRLSSSGWGVMFGPALLCDDPYQAIMAGVEVIEYLGREMVDDEPAHRVRFEQAALNWDMWTAAEGMPVVVKLEFDRAPGATQPAPEGSRITVRYRNWELNPTIPPATFAFDPPNSFQRLTGKPHPEAD